MTRGHKLCASTGYAESLDTAVCNRI